MSLTTLAISPFGRGLARTAAALSRLPMEQPLPAHDALQQHAPSCAQSGHTLDQRLPGDAWK